jgi:hypothetical protein
MLTRRLPTGLRSRCTDRDVRVAIVLSAVRASLISTPNCVQILREKVPEPGHPAKTNGTTKNRRLLRRLQQIDKLPKRDQDALIRTIDAFLAKTG